MYIKKALHFPPHYLMLACCRLNIKVFPVIKILRQFDKFIECYFLFLEVSISDFADAKNADEKLKKISRGLSCKPGKKCRSNSVFVPTQLYCTCVLL